MAIDEERVRGLASEAVVAFLAGAGYGEAGGRFSYAGVECARVADDGGQRVLVLERWAAAGGEPGVPPLGLSPDELGRMRRCCLAYAAESGTAAEDVRLDVVSVLVGEAGDGRPRARIRHLIGAAYAE